MRPVFLSFFLILVVQPAFALTVLKGPDASSYLGDPKQHFLTGPYTCNILERSHRDSMHGRFSDGVIFNTGGGPLEFLKRKDGECLVVVDSTSGREVEPVTEDYWRHKLGNTLSDDNNIPVVFLSDDKKELAVVFIGNDTKVDGKMLDNGLLQISLSVTGGKENRGRRRMMS
jgi:hypothetical protein